jgi:hypothetical protein
MKTSFTQLRGKTAAAERTRDLGLAELDRIAAAGSPTSGGTGSSGGGSN